MLTRVSHVLRHLPHPATNFSHREFGNFVRRTPLRYVDSEGQRIRHPLDVDPAPKPVQQDDATAPKPNRPAKPKTQKSAKSKSTVNGDALEFIRSVTEVTSRNSKKNWAVDNMILLEGEKLIADAFDAGITIHKLYHDRSLTHFKRIQPIIMSQVTTKQVSQSDMAIVSKLTTPPGLMAIAAKPAVASIESKRPADEVMPVTLIGDTISEPGNTGGILRSMAAAGASTLILSEQSTYAWDVKVLRAAAGAHFLVPIQLMSWETIHSLTEAFDRVFFAESPSSQTLDQPAKRYHEVEYFGDPSTRIALFLGSEARGFCPEAATILKEKSAQGIAVPMSSRFDSLNNYVAASIILFEMRKQYDQMISCSK